MVESISGKQQTKEKIHFGWMAGLVLSGAGLTAAAFWAQRFFFIDDPQNLAVFKSILTNFGTALVSAGILLAVEPKLRRVVNTSVTTATATIRADIRKDVQGDIDEKFASLEERIKSSVQGKMTEQDKKLEDIAGSFSRENAMQAMRAAVEMNGLGNQEIIVQAMDKPGQLHIGLKLEIPAQLRDYSEFGRTEFWPEDETLHLVGYPRDSRAMAEVEWSEAEDFGEVIAALLEELQRTGGWGMAVPVDWTTVTDRLTGALKVAIESRRKDPGSIHLQGPLMEVIGTQSPWYLTSQSIECPSHEYVLSRGEFPDIAPNVLGGPTPEEAITPKPDFVDSEEWKYMLARGSDEFTLRVF